MRNLFRCAAGSLYDRHFVANMRSRVATAVAWAPESRWEGIARRVFFAFSLFNSAKIALLAIFVGPLVLFFPVSLMVGGDLFTNNPRIQSTPTDLALSIHAMVFALLACGLCGYARHLFFSAEDAVVLSFYPTPDRQLLRRTAPRWIAFTFYLAYGWAIASAVIVLRDRLEGWQVAAVATFVLLQGWHLLALAIALAERRAPKSSTRPSRYAKIFGVTLVVLGVGIVLPGVGPFFLGEETLRRIALAGFLLPTGWVSGAMNYAVIEGEPAGWLFLIPAAVLWMHAALWLRRGYKIAELRIDSTGVVEPIFECGLANRREKHERQWRFFTAARSGGPVDFLEPIEKRLLNHDALRPADWSGGSLLKRWIGGRLTARERMLVEHVHFPHSGYIPTPFQAALSLLLSVFVIPIFREMEIEWVVHLLPIVFFGMIDSRSPSLHPLWPIGIRETRAVLFKTSYRRALVLFPLLATPIVVVAWERPDRFVYLPVELFVIAMQVSALIEVSLRLRFGLLALRLPQPKGFGALLAIGAGIVLGCGALFYIHWAVSLALAAGMCACIRFGCRQFDRMYAEEELDFQTPLSKASP